MEVKIPSYTRKPFKIDEKILSRTRKILSLVVNNYRKLQTKFLENILDFCNQRWNLKNLSRGLNLPKSAKTRFKFSAGLNLETF